MHVSEIFTPADYPKYTYVARDAPTALPGEPAPRSVEDRLRDGLNTPGEIVSVSGPSKSGKTVLIEKIVGRDYLIPVTGGSIRAAHEVWDKALDWMDVPTSIAGGSNVVSSVGGSVGGKASVGLKILAGASAEASASASRASGKSNTITHGRTGQAQVTREIANSAFVLLIDDFHYMSDEVQREVTEQIKEAARLGVNIVVASVTHRSDAVVRVNNELRGRVRAVDTKPWTVSELKRIAQVGFPLAGINVPDETIERFAIEAATSPQLMQAICLDACRIIGIGEVPATPQNRNFSEAEVKTALEETSTRAEMPALVRNMHAGAKIRGTDRKEFILSDRSRGDVYRVLLLALKSDPPSLSFRWNDLSRRAAAVCVNDSDSPSASSLAKACEITSKMAKDTRTIEWEGEPSNLLTIVDPYFLFYLRWSALLGTLGQGEG